MKLSEITLEPANQAEAERLAEVRALAPHWDREAAIRFIKTGHGREQLEAQVEPQKLQAHLDRQHLDKIRDQLGFGNIATLPQHDQVLEQIASIAKPRALNARPLVGLPPNLESQVATLLAQLPPTLQIRDWFAARKHAASKL